MAGSTPVCFGRWALAKATNPWVGVRPGRLGGSAGRILGLWRQDDCLRTELNRGHLGDGFTLAIQRPPEIAKEWIGIFHQERMNGQPADTPSVVRRVQL